jgi:hypothetical protein
MKYMLTALVCGLAVSSQSFAGIWGSWAAGGTACNNSNVSVIENGSSLSVLFDEFGVVMPEGDVGDGLSARKSCTFRIQLTPPRGFYLAGFKQVYSGGIIKSRRSSAQLNIRYNVGTVRGNPLPIVFRDGDEIRPQDSDSLFSRTYDNNLAVVSCGGSTVYGLNMSMTATRRDYDYEHIMGGLDSVDADFVQRVVLIPAWRLCP